MRKLTLIFAMILAISIFFGTEKSFSYTINDATYDSIGYPTYELFGININQAGSSLTFDIYTNYPGIDTCGSWTTYAADLGLDLNNDSIYEYGVAFRDHDGVTRGELYSVDTTITTTTNYYGTYNDILNGWYTSDHYAPYHHSGIGYLYNGNLPVSIASIIGSSALSSSDVVWSAKDAAMPYYKASVTFDANSIFTDPNYSGSMNVFYGGATCANDYASGKYAPVPEPSSILLLGMGILGLVGLKRKA